MFFSPCNYLPGSASSLLNYILEENWNAVIGHVQNVPQDARRWTNVGIDGKHQTRLLPLHKACAYKPPVSVIDALLQAHPQAAREKQSIFGRIPLHVACMKGSSFEVIRMLIQVYPEGVQVRDSSGRLPLHYAVFRNVPIEVINALLSNYPEGAKIKDRKGWTPIKLSRAHKSTEEVLQALLSTNCEYCKSLNQGNNDEGDKFCPQNGISAAERMGVKQLIDEIDAEFDFTNGVES
mmetsp:Transcript_17258/g.25292  ORF Transcript_17258/g.25292 Transcript_17258/m.25292 type:complete len:236 (+) Transcript_17258:42-749(+)